MTNSKSFLFEDTEIQAQAHIDTHTHRKIERKEIYEGKKEKEILNAEG